MTTKSAEVKIKLERSNELQSYLESFNKEIVEGSDQSVQVLQATDDEDDDGAAGTYFVDQTGNYYYQASKDSESVLTNPTNEGQLDDSSDEILEDEFLDSEKGDKATKNEMTLETEDKKLSFVLIMDEDEKLLKRDEEQHVYEFEEDEAIIGEDTERESKNLLKILPKTLISQQLHLCNYCNYSSSKRYLLARHMKCHSEDRPHKCSVCERGFKTVTSLQNHVNTHTGNKPYRCKVCESSFTTSGELVRHNRYKHTHERPHKCTECDYASVELSKLKRHIRCHTGERPYQCPHCTYASPDTFKLKRHLRIHTGEKPYECDICLARFTQSNSLKAHKLIHSVGEKPVFQCELCPTTCGRKTDLRIHVQKLHTSEKPLKCKRCDNSYPDRYSYKVHSKTHEGEKCFKCHLCPYASISQRHLESHLLIHSDQKPFECAYCDQAFRQKQLLKRHINLYHTDNYVPPSPKEKTHTCPHCKRCFRHKGNLIRHMAQHDPESGIKQEAEALKAGRQRKIQTIGGHTVEIVSRMEEDDNDEDQDSTSNENEEDSEIELKQEDENSLGVANGESDVDYVVLEVIHADENDGNQNPEDLLNVQEDYIISELPSDMMRTLKSSQKLKRMTKSNGEMADCFGFDDEDGNIQINDDKSSIKLLHIN